MMDPDPTPPPAVPPASSQSLARIALASAVVAVGLWILRDFLAALVWATVLAIAFWPIYRRLRQPVPKPIDRVVAPAIATTLIGIIFIAPIVLIGIAVFAADGKMIGRIALPERCANVCFGGRSRNRLFMAASQSLYAVYVNTEGAVGG